ncbi:helix-turn-helix transcriptional regulator [Streptomyces sp. AC550_RSS872]|uniref:helix-turn-helix domain-containing protein n=1 Tax=Streptomyces sp. AC550_RSS872 TaxID=2823689 RepID=UPI001C27C1A8|nr:helix-turn-helix transcriptional regulator [Streptomyces sp. AC550_RSS872]
MPGSAAAVGALDLSRGDAATGTDSHRLRQEAGALCAALAHLQDPGPGGQADGVPDAGPPLTPNVGAAPPPAGLVEHRETEIAVLAGGGRTNRQIARAPAVSHTTVETHPRRISKKLRFSSRARWWWSSAAPTARAVRPAPPDPGAAGLLATPKGGRTHALRTLWVDIDR